MASVRRRKWSAGSKRKPDGTKSGDAWEVSWNDGGKRRKKSGFKTKAAAEAFATERQKETNDGLSRPLGHRMTLAELKVEYLENVRQRVARDVIGPGHLINMTGHFKNYIDRQPDFVDGTIGAKPKAFTGAIGQLPISKIRSSTVEKFRDDLLGSGCSPHLVRGIITTLSSTLDFGRRRDYIATNAAFRIKVERPRDQRNERVTPPSVELIQKVIAGAPDEIQLAIQFSACTGLRAGELRALKYRHIDTVKRQVTVRLGLNVLDQVGPPKSDAGIRDIPLAPELLTLLEQHRQNASSGRKNDLVFPRNDSGELMPRKALNYRLQKVLIGLGLASEDDTVADEEDDEGDGDGFSWHGLRHFAISSWIAEGMGLKAVQTFAGHADVTTTWNRYGHLFPNEDHWNKIAAATRSTLLIQ
jgi:integrase